MQHEIDDMRVAQKAIGVEQAAKLLLEEVQRLTVSAANAARKGELHSMLGLAKRADEAITSAVGVMAGLRELRHQANYRYRQMSAAAPK
jgi:hypothetical protein